VCRALILLWLALSVPLFAAPSGSEILARAASRDLGRSFSAEIDVSLADQYNFFQSRKANLYQINTKGEIRSAFLLRLPSPTQTAGILTFDFADPARDADQWLYQPDYKGTRHIYWQDRKTAFFDTDFALFDFLRPKPQNYTLKILKEETWDGKKVWILEALPISDRVILESGYKKSIFFIRQDNFAIVRSIHWLYKNELVKVIDVKTWQEIEGKWFPLELEIETRSLTKPLHKTKLFWRTVEINTAIDKNVFSPKWLEQGG
jgi:hypothetical protein